MPRLELFHRLAEPESAAARRRVLALGLEHAVAFRNVEFESHRDALAARGGSVTPALWDGGRLHAGLVAIEAALRAAAPGPPIAAATQAPLPPAPAEAVDAAGRPVLGAFAGAIGRAALERRRAPGLRGRLAERLRVKRWAYALVAADEVMAGAAIVEAGWFGGAFAWAADRRTGAILAEGSATGLPGRAARVPDRPEGRASFSGGGLAVALDRSGPLAHLSVRLGEALGLEATLEARGAPAPFTLVAPVPGDGVRATQKAGPFATSGRLVVRGRTLPLEGGLAGLDHTAGLLARETAWRWAFGLARAPGGAPFAFNLCEGFAGVPPDDPGENALLAAGGPLRLPPVAFAFDRLDPMAAWRIASADGRVELTFRPRAAHRERRELGLVRTRFVQVAGAFDGVLPGPDGAPLAVVDAPGVVEDHFARW